MRNTAFLALKELKYLLRDREMILWVFLMPPLFTFFIGTVTSRFGGPGGTVQDALALYVPPDAGFLADAIEQRLLEQDFAVHRQADPEPMSSFSRQLFLPAGLTESVLDAERVTVRFVQEGSDLAGEWDRLRVGRAVYTVLADLVAAAQSEAAPTDETLKRIAELPRSVQIEVRPAGKRKDPPTGFEQAVPGTMVAFVLLVMLSGGAASIILERKAGLLRRLASSPVSPGEIFWGKWLGRFGVGLVQTAVSMIAAVLLFRMRWGPDLPMVALVLLAWAGLCVALALLLVNLTRTEGQAVGIGVLAANLLAPLGGCWWPIEVTPRWMQALAKALPTGWTMDAMHQLISFQAGAASAIPHLTALVAATLLLGWLGARTFRYL